MFSEIDVDSITPSVVAQRIIYIGETTKQTLLERFVQIEEAALTVFPRHLAYLTVPEIARV